MKDFIDKSIGERDGWFLAGIRRGDPAVCREFFYREIAGILHRIRMEVYHGRVDFDEMVSELYLFLSRDGWSKLAGFEGKNGCRLRTWMIPLSWRFFVSMREKLGYSDLWGEELATRYHPKTNC